MFQITKNSCRIEDIIDLFMEGTLCDLLEPTHLLSDHSFADRLMVDLFNVAFHSSFSFQCSSLVKALA